MWQNNGSKVMYMGLRKEKGEDYYMLFNHKLLRHK